MFRQLGEEGYLKRDIFIDKRVQTEEKIEEGRIFCMVFQNSDMKDQQNQIRANDPERIYIPIDGPRNSSGADPILPTSAASGWTVTLISKNCKDPERAIAFLSFLLSEEGQRLTYLGVEGEMYDMVDGEPVIRQEVQELLLQDRKQYDSVYRADYTYWMMEDIIRQANWSNYVDDGIRLLKEWTRPYVVYIGQYERTIGISDADAELLSNVEKLWGMTLTQLLLADSEAEFDRILKAFIRERDEMGYEDLQIALTECINRSKERLGME